MDCVKAELKPNDMTSEPISSNQIKKLWFGESVQYFFKITCRGHSFKSCSKVLGKDKE